MAEKPRVLTISKPYVAAAYRRKLALMANRGLEIGLICPPAWGAQTFEPWEGDRAFWLRQVPIFANGHNHFHTYRGLYAAMAAFRPDIVNVEEEHYSLVTAQVLHLAQRLKARTVFYTWQNIAKRYPPPFCWIERYVFNRAAAGVAGNQEAADILRKKGFRSPLAIIPQMGVDIDLFCPDDPGPAARRARRRQLGLPDTSFCIGFFGRLVPEKGLDTLIEALTKLPPPSAGAPSPRVLLGGDGPAKAELEALAATLGVRERVDFIPAVPSRSVAPYLQAVDAVCLPSRTRANWKEQFGRLLTEAMAAQAVVIGSASGEIPNVIADCGMIFPEGEAAALATTLQHLIANPDFAAGLRRQALRRVREHFSDAVIADHFATLFHQLHQKSPPAIRT